MRFERHVFTAVATLLGLSLVMAGCGGGGGGSGGGNDLLSVRDVQGFPNGKFFTNQPTPTSTNQCIWVEFTAPVNASTVFDGTTANGLSSNVRILSYFYTQPSSALTPASPLTVVRLPGVGVLNGRTNFNTNTNSYGSSANQTVTHAELNIPTNVPLSGNFFVFVADTDGDFDTIESFLPADIRNNVGRLQNSQIMVNLTDGVVSTGGRKLSPERTESFVVGTADQIAPVVDSAVPTPGAANVPIGDPIVIRFSEPVDASSVVVAPQGDTVPSGIGGVNLQVSAQIIVPPNTTPQPVSLPGTISPTSGLTTEITFTPLATFPGETVMAVNIYSGASTFFQASPPFHPATTDAIGNTLAPNAFTDLQFTFTTGPGPKLANNPVAPQVVHFLTGNSEIGAIETVETDGSTREDFLVPVDETGSIKFRLSGNLLDLELGDFIANYLIGPGTNFIGQPPQQAQYLSAGIVNGNPPRPLSSPPPPLQEYRPPGTAVDAGPCPPIILPIASQPIGNFLFVSNEDSNVVHVINSNTYQIFKDIQAPDPRGLAIGPLLRFLYVSNFGGGSVSVFDITADPNDNLPRGQLIRTIPTGNGPDALSVNPDGEDLFVINRQDNSVSVVQLNQLSSPDPVRVTVTGNIGPQCVDVCTTGRIPALPPQFPNLPPYAYFANLGADNVAVFESGPQQINGYGRDNIIQVVNGFPTPTAINSDERSGATAATHDPINRSSSLTGCWVACSGDDTARYLRATRFRFFNIPNPPPAFIGVDYEISTTIKTGERPQDLVLRDPYVVCQGNNNKHIPDIVAAGGSTDPDRLYVANGDGSVSVIDLATGTEVVRLRNGGVRKMAAFYTN